MFGLNLRHYSNRKLEAVHSRTQKDTAFPFDKPDGLWLSVGESWKIWCDEADFGKERLAFVHDVFLTEAAKILHVANAADLDFFTDRFSAVTLDFLPDMISINWKFVAEHYQGVIISPYIYERRLHPKTRWYYGWDCASGCIWDASAVRGIMLRDGKTSD
jgi:hypothetical protein